MSDILIVDDETAIADLVEVCLKNEGYTVHKFYNATDALDCLNHCEPDLAILDVMLPDMDGFLPCARRSGNGISSPSSCLPPVSRTWTRSWG